MLAAAGVPTPDTYARPRRCSRWRRARRRDWPEEVFAQISESQTGRCIRTDKWTYSVSVPERAGRSDVYFEEYLYDNENDPYQRENLVSDPSLAGIRGSLAETSQRRMAEAGEEQSEIRAD